jgi:hypothetical protein
MTAVGMVGQSEVIGWRSSCRLVLSSLHCVTGTALLELLNHAIEIGIAGAKASCEPVSAALRNTLAVGDYLKLTGLPRRNHGFNAEPLLDEGRETRDLSLVVLSRWAGNYLDLHSVLQSAW